MTPSIVLNPDQRQALLDRYRKDRDPEVRFRAHILLLLADGYTWATVATILFCSSRTIDRWVKRYQQQGIEALGGQKRGRPFRFDSSWIQVVLDWVSKHTPARVRLPPEPLVLRGGRPPDAPNPPRRGQPRDGPCWLHRGGMVYRRPRPVLGPKDPERQAKLDALRKLLDELPEDETAVFQDEVDINTNPKIGAMWMFKGQQAKVETPGNNEKRDPSGSIHWRTGQVFLTEGEPKQGATRRCSWRTWMISGAGCDATVRST